MFRGSRRDFSYAGAKRRPECVDGGADRRREFNAVVLPTVGNLRVDPCSVRIHFDDARGSDQLNAAAGFAHPTGRRQAGELSVSEPKGHHGYVLGVVTPGRARGDIERALGIDGFRTSQQLHEEVHRIVGPMKQNPAAGTCRA